MQNKTISLINQKILSKEESKIKYLEGRLKSPNNIGNAPAEYIPLKQAEIDKIKAQMIIIPPSTINISNKKRITPSKKKRSITNVKIEMFLNKKRKNSSQSNIFNDDNFNNNLNNNSNVAVNDEKDSVNSIINFNLSNSKLSDFSKLSKLSDSISGKSSFTNNTKEGNENNSALFSGKNISNKNY